MKNLYVLVLLVLVNSFVYAQVGINVENPKATLDIGAIDINTPTNSEGLLIPRINDFPSTDPTVDQDGMMVFITGNGAPLKGIYYWDFSTTTSTGNWVGIGSKKYKIGDFAQGGIVFWVDETGEHGLVCAKTDLPKTNSSGSRWIAGTMTTTLAYGDGLFAGKQNTTLIISNQELGDSSMYPARTSNELQVTENGITYGDWYLPSKLELFYMYQNKSVIEATAIANGGDAFTVYKYWSSTEDSSYYYFAWSMDFLGNQYSTNKGTLNIARAIRSF